MKCPVIVAVGALVLAACGGASDPIAAGPDEIVLPTPAPGPVPELPVSAAAAMASPLPEIAVRRLNGDGGWIQFKNEVPSDVPLLIWFWAPF